MTHTLDHLVSEYAGVPYVWGGIPEPNQDPRGFEAWDGWKNGWDCSGMTYWVNRKFGDQALVRGSHYQYQQLQQAGRLFTAASQLKAGDLIFFDTGWQGGAGAELNRAGHVGIYIGGDKFFHAANPEIDTLVSKFSGYWAGLFIGGAHTPLAQSEAAPTPMIIRDGDKEWNGLYDLVVNQSVYYGHITEVTVVVDELNRRVFAHTDFDIAGPPLHKGDRFKTRGFVVGKEPLDPPEWWIADDFSRIWSGGTKPKTPEVDPTTRPINGFDQIVGKKVFHAANPKTGQPITVKIAKDGGTLFKYASVNAPPARKRPLKKGEEFVVNAFIHAAALNGETWWWRTADDKRINVSETVEKPYIVEGAESSVGANIGIDKLSVAGGAWAALDVHNPEIANAAKATGVPPNLIKSMINRESSGDWERDGSRAVLIPGRESSGPILPFVGIFEVTANSWGFNFNEMIGNKQLQILVMATIIKGLAKTYSGFDKAATVYFGGPGALTKVFTDEFGMTSSKYTRETLKGWRYLDSLVSEG